MASNPAKSLHWIIAQSKLPATLKSTLNTVALWANADEGYENIYASKRTIGKRASRSEQVIRRDCTDLEHFKILIVKAAPPGRPKRYQIWVEGILNWSDAHTAEYRQRRRRQQSKRKRRTGAAPMGDVLNRFVSRLANDPSRTRPGSDSLHLHDTPTGYDRGAPGTYDRGGAETPIVPDSPSLKDYLRDDRTVAERGERPVHAVENSAAPVANLQGGSARPTMYAGPPNLTRHRAATSSQLDNMCLMRPSEVAEENVIDLPDATVFDALRRAGYTSLKKMAGEGGEVHWSDVRADLRSCFAGLKIDHAKHPDIVERVEAYLYVQHLHHVQELATNPKRDGRQGEGATPRTKSAVRASGEVSP